MSFYPHPIIILSDSDVEDTFSSTHSPDYIPASPNYFPASPGNTSPNFSDDLTNDLLASLALSPSYDDPYIKKISPPKDGETPVKSPIPISPSSSVGSSSPVRSTTPPPDYPFDKPIFAELDNSLWIIPQLLGSEPVLEKPNKSDASPAMTQAAIRQLVANSIVVALESQAVTMASTDNPNRNIRLRETPVARKCTYKEFMSCQPFYFNVLPLSPMFDSRDFFPPKEIPPPKDTETPVESPIPISPSSSVGSSSPVRSTTPPPDYPFDESIFAELDNSLWIIPRPLGSEPVPEESNEMAPKRTSTSATPPMTQAAIKKLVADSVAADLEAEAATMASTSNPNRNTGPAGTPITKTGNYKEFISCQPFYFNGMERAVGLICCLTDDALSLWNAYAQPIGIEQANKITWTELKRLLTNKFHELAVLCPNMVPNTEKLHVKHSIEITRVLNEMLTASKLKLGESHLHTPRGSFDIVIGMDWLSKYHASIICDEKVVHIPIDGKTLIIRAQVIEKKYDEKRLEDKPVVREFLEVFPKDLPGLPPVHQVEFQIDLIPGAAPVA
ncbi:hypothetical protein Tco_0976607 [Tanacetum coccineum]|uniref:Reverse transcriptase domain-containing protein n=1 Tax=Tanacetum coccineum TaxID=301880 RepID=A0ABQ5EHS9_9ASTR